MIELIPVDLSVKKIKVPVANITWKIKEKRLLVTAGLDGDEYAGIEAAYKIIEELSSKKFRGYLTVIPILNIPGFEAKQSCNPLDNKFPKHVLFPGKNDGSPTERLMYWLSNNYLKNCNLWVDLHSGAIDEQIEPFIWTYETKNKELNEVVEKIIEKTNVSKAVFEKPDTQPRIEALAKIDVARVISEAGYSGERSDIWIEKHIEIVKLIMEVLEMRDKATKESYHPRIYRRVEMYKARCQGLWYPGVSPNSLIKEGRKLGVIRSYSGKLLEEVKSRHAGEYLWGKKGLSCQKGDVLIGMGCEEMNIADIK